VRVSRRGLLGRGTQPDESTILRAELEEEGEEKDRLPPGL
jgi:hypothetical protein